MLAAINVAGYDADLDSASNHPLRQVVRKELSAKQLSSVEDLKRFFVAHRQKNETAELSQYVSFALTVDGPPEFAYKVRTVEIPPDVVPLEGLGPLLASFYLEANIDELWKKSQPAFEQVIARYHEPVSRAVLEVNGFLRNPAAGYLGRRFQIYVDLLGAPNQIQTRSYGDDYYVVLTPSPAPQAEDVRHAYLHYLLDPLATKYAEYVLKKKALADYAQAAPALEQHYKSDFLLLTTESLIKAIESKLKRNPELVQQALRQGYVLTPHFAEQLIVYERQKQAMRLFFPELVQAIDLKREEARLEKIEFAANVRVRPAKVVPAAEPPPKSGALKTLDEAEELYTNRELDKARQSYLHVLQQTGDKPLHARSYYGLARIAVLKKDPELAERLFQKALESEPEPQIMAWTHVYLGRLADAAGDREQASRHYQSALGVNGASVAARQAAEKEMQQRSKKQEN